MAALETRATAGPETTNPHPSDRGLEDTHAGLALQGRPGRATPSCGGQARPGRGPLGSGTAADGAPEVGEGGERRPAQPRRVRERRGGHRGRHFRAALENA